MPSNETVYGHSAVRGVIHAILVGSVALIRTATIIFGTLSVLLIDIALGATTLTLIITHSPEVSLVLKTVHIPAAFIGTAISAGTSAIQLSMWDSVIRGKRQTHATWGALGLIIMLDTLLDVACVGWLMYGTVPTHIFAPAPQPPIYWVLVGLVGLLAMCDSYYLNMLIQHLRDDDDDVTPSVRTSNRPRLGERLRAMRSGWSSTDKRPPFSSGSDS